MQEEGTSASVTNAQVTKAVEGLPAELLDSKLRVSVKFLVSQNAAGVVIGKGGTNIVELQHNSGARIQLSRNNEFYPGTGERILLVQGQISQVLTALCFILQHVTTRMEPEVSGQLLESGLQLKLIMPATVCGAIIGRGGETVKSFTEDSGAHISVTPLSHVSQEMFERIVTVSGSVEQLLRAVALILSKVANEPNYQRHPFVNKVAPYPQPFALPAPAMLAAPMPAYPAAHQAYPVLHSAAAAPQLNVTMAMSVPAERVGAIIGRSGEQIRTMQSLCNVRISISARDEAETGPGGAITRRVEITGTPEAINIAQALILQKLHQAPMSPMMSGGQHGA